MALTSGATSIGCWATGGCPPQGGPPPPPGGPPPPLGGPDPPLSGSPGFFPLC